MNRIFGLVGRSGSGKTTLLEALLPVFTARGLRVNVVKHSHHDVQLEPPHKDSARMRHAGAAEVMLASPYRFAVFRELRGASEPGMQEQLARLAPADLTLVEGFKQWPIARLEVFRPALEKAPLYPNLPGVIAVASDRAVACDLPFLDLNDFENIADFILINASVPDCLNEIRMAAIMV